MSRRWPKQYAPYSTCDRCGWTGCDWAFKYQGLCSKCYKAWKQQKREAIRKLKPPNDNLEIAKGLIVTRNVQKRLLQQSHMNVPPIKHYELMDWIGILAPLPIGLILFAASSHPASLIAIPILILLAVFVTNHKNKKLDERAAAVNAELQQLARQRKARIEEAKLFYTSPEWRLLRKQVIEEKGATCNECGQVIRDPFDITVDHIKPRSIYPHEALKFDNLQILCRSCNARKGDNIINESDFQVNT